MSSVQTRDYFEKQGYTVDYNPSTGNIRVYDPKTGASSNILKGAYNLSGGTSTITGDVAKSIERELGSGKYNVYDSGKVTPPASYGGKGGAVGGTVEPKKETTWEDVDQYIQQEVSRRLSAEIGEWFQGVKIPYQQDLEQLLRALEIGPQMTPEEMQQRAQMQAGLLYDPQVNALTRALEQQQQSAEARRASIEAAYAGVSERTARLMEEARQRAVESAVARGGGRGGLVEWLTGELQTPIIERQQQIEAERASQLADVANALGLIEKQVAEQEQQLATQRGQYITQQVQALEELDYARRTGDWQRAFEAAQTLSNMAAEQQRQVQDYALRLIESGFLGPNWTQEESVRSGLFESLGTMPDVQSGTPQRAVPVREYVASHYPGQTVGYDPATREVIIGNTRIPLADLGKDQYGGYFDSQTNRAYLLPHIIDRILRGY